jgi:hypothetical protein
MRLALLGIAALGTWLFLRRRKPNLHRVVVAWEDGSELELRSGSAERKLLVGIAEGVLG